MRLYFLFALSAILTDNFNTCRLRGKMGMGTGKEKTFNP
ncbi:hypothetical protein NIES37_50750 [Tolypothrix tenuis PCC 7101]|uniref:Uncharacterized protein n=1 Tax=Tolypothrix tenuis PCC 7101 TaxID=231146 RepID=A0A1Z4N5U0_9CYAN|nr:hypothetical protein NIES37_50750 [Tolypothrix tenuis PCC 7101]BAZ75001.1 hypothetical protein NIES50_35810 [Aulosira laxa NIES-50]